jgi:hypothetical protein
VPGESGDQHEKFLFYRGVGNFRLPVDVRLDSDSILVKNSSMKSIKKLVLFERRGSDVGFEICESLTEKASIARPVLNQSVDDVRDVIERVLEDSGLYEKEANAMLETWRDTWFEEGLRLFYLLPESDTEAILPLSIDPSPSKLIRVMVGRVEIITPEIEREAHDAISTSDEDRLRRLLTRHARFAEAILIRTLRETPDKSARIERLLSSLSR